jgi:hypothetical protein
MEVKFMREVHDDLMVLEEGNGSQPEIACCTTGSMTAIK